MNAVLDACERQTDVGAADTPQTQSLVSALREAFGHRSYVLLVLGFFTCGFQLAFVTAHLPSYLVDRGLPAPTGGWVLAVIGLFNIFGALIAGWRSHRMPNRYILSGIYMIRAISIAIFISVPLSPTSAIIYGMVTGLTWLDGAADDIAGQRDVRHSLAGDAVWLCVFQPSGRRISWRLAGRYRI